MQAEHTDQPTASAAASGPAGAAGPSALDAWGLTEQDHIDGKVEDLVRDLSANFTPELAYLVERYYGNRGAYIKALEQQAALDRHAVADAAPDAPTSWRLARLLNAASCATKAELERAALPQAAQ